MPGQPVEHQPLTILQTLIRFDTTNPPGNEAACIAYINDLLKKAGIESQVFAKAPNRPNLLARLPGKGNAVPLLLYGHVDVVTTENQAWEHPPFSADIVDGFVWGRGALDMKGGVAMLIAAFLQAKTEQLELPGDLLLLILSDEEDSGDFGAKFLVDEHADLFKGVRYALGEFGGFSLSLGGKRFYPIQVAEKQVCWTKLTVRGQGGHGSIPVKNGAMAKLAAALIKLDTNDLPVHITPAAKEMFTAMAAALGGASGLLLGQLTNPLLADSVLGLLGARGRIFYPLVRNTVSPTILHASSKINVIPGEVSVELDGRLLPGFTPQDMLGELRQILGNEVELEIVRHDPGPAMPDMGLFNMLAGVLREADPAGNPVPLMLSGVTDGRYFSQIGIQTYGFLPMQLPEDFNFSATIHAANERIPVATLDFGARAILEAIKRVS